MDDIIDLPSGYVRLLRYNLAVELSTEYGRQLDDRIEQMAVGAKSFIKTTNGAQKQTIAVVDAVHLEQEVVAIIFIQENNMAQIPFIGLRLFFKKCNSRLPKNS